MENKQIKFLAVDDNRDNLISLKAIIYEEFPQSVVYLELSGQGGIESARKNEPDIILLDIVMPGMDGYQVCKILKADEQLSETPIIFLTALKGDKQSRVLALEAGGEAFLAKPIDAIELKAQILAMLKIKEAATYKRAQRLQLEELVQQRTEELKSANMAALNLLEDLKAENEIRKQREAELRESEERFRVAQEFSPDGFTILHPLRNEKSEIVDFTWVYENQTIARFNGTDPEDVIGKRLLDLFQSHKGTSVFEAYIYVANSRQPLILEEVYVGEILSVPTWLRLVVVPMSIDIAILAQDITERKQAEEKLKLLNRAVEASSVSVVITDADGHINYVNPYYTELTGYAYEEVRGKNPRFLNSGNQPKIFYKELWNTILSGKEWTGEFLNRKKNGELFWENAVISPILNSNGKVTNFVAIKDDITEKKKILQELVIAKEQAEGSDRLKSAFLANMSHEIRTPLNSIIGFSELLGDPYFEAEQKKEFIDHIVKNGNNLLNIISDIVEISKMEVGEITIRKSKLQVNNFMNEIQSQYTHLVNEKRLQLKRICRCHELEDDFFVIADRERLVQVFNNLISNALKFTSEGFIQIGCKPSGNMIEFHVKDSGIGISIDFHERIFDRFRQVDGEKTRNYGGNGLGLAISKNLVELMGGQIWVDSELGKGSTFYFTIPCIQ